MNQDLLRLYEITMIASGIMRTRLFGDTSNIDVNMIKHALLITSRDARDMMKWLHSPGTIHSRDMRKISGSLMDQETKMRCAIIRMIGEGEIFHDGDGKDLFDKTGTPYPDLSVFGGSEFGDVFCEIFHLIDCIKHRVI